LEGNLGSAHAGGGGMTAALDVEDVTVRFGGLTALEDVSMTARAGEVVGVIGPNGAGKTTLFNCVCGFVAPEAGRMRWEGAPLDGVRPRQLARRGIARTLQGLGLFEGLTAIENVMAGAEVHARAGLVGALFGLPRSDRDERALRALAQDALDDLGVGDVAERLPGSLPYPVRKRVSLARALVSRPRLLLLDEPAGGLGADDLRDLAALIGRLRSEMAVVLVEHHMDLVMQVCDRVVVLDFGRLIATGTPAEVQADPAVLDAYLGVEARA
jgi:branched-chain amino acid transport system ATP-binding protein